jgi:hypothetical protein
MSVTDKVVKTITGRFIGPHGELAPGEIYILPEDAYVVMYDRHEGVWVDISSGCMIVAQEADAQYRNDGGIETVIIDEDNTPIFLVDSGQDLVDVGIPVERLSPGV